MASKGTTDSVALREKFVQWIENFQSEMCSMLEKEEGADGKRFESIPWNRPEGGGGLSRILSNGKIFEKAGVNISTVHGQLPELLVEKLKTSESEFFAAGVSIVIHPHSPCIPTVHANWRFFQQPNKAWMGGGADLTPYVLSEEDFQLFHQNLKRACDQYRPDAYAKFKKECDQYFLIAHRKERRGIGGIFFDYITENLEDTFKFAKDAAAEFLNTYQQIVSRRKESKFSERQKKFQLLRRGRYIEFNLVYDRGTLFGLQTKGNTESILMSLPPVAHFDFDAPMETNDEEGKLTSIFRDPRDWISNKIS